MFLDICEIDLQDDVTFDFKKIGEIRDGDEYTGYRKSVCHLHGEFDKLSPKYDVNSLYYKADTQECTALIAKKVAGMEHVYSNTIMCWSWLDKYGELTETDTKAKETLIKIKTANRYCIIIWILMMCKSYHII